MTFPESAARPLVIAHRGACGYLPEHTLEAKVLAAGQGADYLEQDVVATRDDHLVVLHDIHLDRVTDVAEVFPDRHRADRRYYVRDFDLDELRRLRVWERFTAAGSRDAVYPARFPPHCGRFAIASLEDELELVAGLQRSLGRIIGVYPEIKRPEWHRGEGVDVGALLLETLAGFGYRGPDDPVYVQCFDAAELERLRHELDCRLRLVQLIGDSDRVPPGNDEGELDTARALDKLARTVDAIGPPTGRLYTCAAANGEPLPTGLADRARRAGLAVHAYTFRADALARGFASMADMVRWFAGTAKIDGLFTDFPDIARNALR